MDLSVGQRKVINKVLSKQNVFFTGPAGTGKSFLLEHLKNLFKNRENVYFTASTGKAAVNIGATTFHSLLRIGTGENKMDLIIRRIKSNPVALDLWINLEILVIDEISMVSAELFTKLELLGRYFQDDNLPFGGIQLILSGDLFQLPPVSKNRKGLPPLVNESPAWSLCFPCWDSCVVLETIFRQEEKNFQKVLNSIRIGQVTEDCKNVLQARCRVVPPNPNHLVHIYCTNPEVHRENKRRLDLLVNQPGTTYRARTNPESIPHELKKLQKHAPVVQELVLKVGARVMLVKNLDLARGLCNGTLGTVVSTLVSPTVRFETKSGPVTLSLERSKFSVFCRTKLLASFEQFPLMLAFAISCHKIQGVTLDECLLDLKTCFTFGQAYVGISRVRTLEGLYLRNFDPKKIQAHPKALAFNRQLLTMENELSRFMARDLARQVVQF